MDQFSWKGAPVVDHIEPIDGYEQVSELLPNQVLILIELFKLLYPIKKVLFEHLGLPWGMQQPNVTIACCDKWVHVAIVGEI